MARLQPDEATRRLFELATTYLRQPSGMYLDDATGPVLEFHPPLSTAQQATYDRLRTLARSRVVGITAAEWQALEAALSDLRAFRAQSAAEFSALTAAQRDAAQRTALFGVIDVLRAILRD